MVSKFEEFSNLLSKECSICCEDYNNNEKKPVVMDCGHTVCIMCLKPILQTQKKCPFDKLPLKQRLENYPVNWSYLEVLNNLKKINKPLSEYENYRKILSDEGEYEGQISKKRSGIPYEKNGYGIMNYNDGSNYTGYWKDNKK